MSHARLLICRASFFGILCLLLLSPVFHSCVSPHLSKVDADPNFDWNTLKRDQILMTPLLDLRGSVSTPPGFENLVAPFSNEQATAYPEKFKQEFFHLRKDIRVFGAGGAFEKISKIENLADIGAKVLKKEPLAPEDVLRIRKSNQDIRFIFFYVFAGESLQYGYGFNAPHKKHYVEKSYYATRTMNIKLALWDSKEAKTVWIGEKILSPSNVNVLRFKKPNFNLKKIPKEDQNIVLSNPDAFDFNNSSSLEYELEHHRSRFPEFPGREPSFSSVYEDFALKLPLNPSEENLIEYEHFSNDRGEIGLSGADLGHVPVARLRLNFSSMIYNFYRLGADFYFDLNAPRFLYEGKYYDVSSFAIGISNDLEWELSDKWRLLTGATLGILSYKIQDVAAAQAAQSSSNNNSDSEESTSNKSPDKSDSSFFARPRVHLLRGAKRGGQLGFGAYYIYRQQPQHPLLLVRKPSQWGVELTASYTVRGF